MSDPFLAEIKMFGGNFSPRGWAFCDGQLLSIAQYTALFSLLGTVYGGDGQTTFALPELRGRVAMHAGNGPGLSPRPQGQKAGTETNTLNSTQIPSHNHIVTPRGAEEGTTDDPTNANVAGDGTNAFAGTSDVNLASITSGNTGGGQPVNNLQPFTTVRYIIALVGIYPSRN